MDFPSGSALKNPPAIQETQEMRVRSLDWEDPLKEGMATHSSILAWRNPMDRGTWWATVHRVGDTRLSNQGILQVALMVKNLPTNAGDIDEGLLLGLGRPAGRGHGSPLQYSCLEKPHGQRSLVG